MVALAAAMVLSSTAPVAHCQACALLAQAAPAPSLDRRGDLRQQIDELNWKIRSTSTDWPPSALVLSYVGYVLAPFLIAGLGLAVAALFAGPSLAVLLYIGIGALVLGAVGVACLIAGISMGIAATSDSKHQKEELIHQRQLLENELRSLRPEGVQGSKPTVWIASLSF